MSQETAIEWTDLSWNPVHGCSVVSPGCARCYAATLSLRYGHTKLPWTPANAADNVLLKPHKLREPLSVGKDWRGLGAAAAAAGKTDGKLVFVNSMSDLFHEEIPPSYIWQCLDVMREAERHTFQVLTKRPERMRQLVNAWYALSGSLGEAPAAPNIWLGVSIENRRFVGRADILRETHAAVRFISAEPLLGPLVPHGRSFDDAKWGWYTARHFGSEWNDDPGLDLTGIDWLIVGGESGKGARLLDLQWMRDLRDATRCRWCGGTGTVYEQHELGMTEPLGCQDCCGLGRTTAFFVKQLGGARPGTKLEDLPEDLRIREFPRQLSVEAARR